MHMTPIACLSAALSLSLPQLCFAQVDSVVNSDRGDAPVTYRLNESATYEHGCFPPCLCPSGPQLQMFGTFTLSPLSITGFIDRYAVQQVNWIVPIEPEPIHITGHGIYSIGGEFALMQRLQMRLRIGDEPVEEFDSGWLIGSGSLDPIDITISMNGLFCLDTAIHVAASPVAAADIAPYDLEDTSTFQHGCFNMCDCAVGPELPLGGSMTLMPIGQTPSLALYSVNDVRWVAEGASPGLPGPLTAVTGLGIYMISNVPGEPTTERLVLRLSVADLRATEFDSGWVPGGDQFPVIDDVLITMNDLICLDMPMHISASPLP